MLGFARRELGFARRELSLTRRELISTRRELGFTGRERGQRGLKPWRPRLDSQRMRPLAVTLLALLCLFGSSRGLAEVPGTGGGLDLAAEPLEVTLGELRAAPSRRIGRRVQFAVQVASVGEPWTPYPTRFGAANWTRVEGWSDEQHLWEREAYLDAAPYLFVRKRSLAEWRLQRARPHERWWVTARVGQVFAGEPWIEIESAERLTQHVGEGSVLHASRAFDLWERGQRALALAELERAMAGPLPEAASAALEAQWRTWSERFQLEPTPPTVQPIPGVETVYHLKLGPENLPQRRKLGPVPLPASAPRTRD